MLLRELDGEGGFVRLWLPLALMRMEVILLFQLGERFGFEAGLVGVGNKDGTVVTRLLTLGDGGGDETEGFSSGTFRAACGL